MDFWLGFPSPVITPRNSQVMETGKPEPRWLLGYPCRRKSEIRQHSGEAKGSAAKAQVSGI